MKKTIILFCALAMLCASASAQFRKLTAQEIDFLDKLHASLYDALPHEHSGWKAVEDGREWDTRKYWCGGGEPSCLGTCPVSVGKSEPYQLNYPVEFTIPDDQKNSTMMTAMGELKDYSNAKQVAAFLKATSKYKLQVHVYSSNQSTPFKIRYCPKNPLVQLSIPVKTTLAVMGIRSADCPILEDGRPDMHANYYDGALVMLGKPVTTQHTLDSDGTALNTYTVGFDNAKMGKFITQNIVVEFIGDAKDIKEAVAAVNWQKLSDLIEK